MKNTFKITRAAVFAAPVALLAGMASAGGLAAPVETVAPTPVAVAPAPMMRASDWTGFYAGAQLGYGQLDANVVTDPVDPDGAVYGVHAGYMYDLGSIVLGGEIDYDATNIDFTSPATAGAQTELDSVLRAKLRAGYDAGAFLPYLTAGGARATTSGALDGETDGNFYGLGVAYKFGDSIIVGGEVLQHEFKDVVVPGVNVDATTATARVSFQF